MGAPRRPSRTSGVGEDFLEEGIRRAEGLADRFSEPMPAITKKSRRPSLELGKSPVLRKRKRTKYQKLHANWLVVKPQKNYRMDQKEGFVTN